ncbi:MAG: alpha/beta hydrolase [Rhodospirillales bacterium]|nr:alpha/beta hydrolase [Rhodospirillales bacterium]
MPTLVNKGLTINYIKAGQPKDAADTLCLLHCSTSSHGQWRLLWERLQDRYRVLAPDLLGYGETGAWPGTDDGLIRAEGDLVRALTADLDSYHLLGHSYGGASALRLALEEPYRLKSLTLIEPIAIFLLDPERDAGPYETLREIAEVYRSEVGGGNPDAGIKRYFDYWNGDGAFASAHPRTRDYARDTAFKCYHEFDAIFDTVNKPAPLSDLTMPVHILRGADTQPPAHRITTVLADALPHAQVTEIAGAGHMSPITHATSVNEAVETFLNAI